MAKGWVTPASPELLGEVGEATAGEVAEVAHPFEGAADHEVEPAVAVEVLHRNAASASSTATPSSAARSTKAKSR